tara:strand:+ start:3175 stop:5199 length:2025 start_codon:yes stop_codon:yes gene_type:complete
MSYHNIPSSAIQSTTNAQGQIAPEGYHYMPDGSLMSDAEHVARYGSGKVIRSFILDTTNLKAGGEVRKFTVTGNGVFSLEVRNEDNYYYNFVTNLFQVASARLDNISISNTYSGKIIFPKVTDADQYDFFLFADQGSTHANYNEVRFEDGSLDINSTTGSNSLLIKKVIFQTLDVNLTLSTLAPLAGGGFAGHSPTNKVITTQIGKNVGKIPFSIPVSGAATHSFKINRTPTSKDVFGFVERTIGSAPENIPGENVFPAGTGASGVDGTVSSGVKVVIDHNVATIMKVGDKITATPTTGLTVDGAVTSGNKIVMSNDVANVMNVGDRVTITDPVLETGEPKFWNTDTYVVAALNPDGDNTREFQVGHVTGFLVVLGSETRDGAINDGVSLTFTPKLNRELTTVVALNPDGDNVKEFSMSQAVGLVNNTQLQFFNRKNYSWPLNNVDGISPNMVVIGTNVASGTVVSSYEEAVTEMQGTIYSQTKVKKSVRAINKKGVKPTIAIDGTTKLKTVTQTGDITFNKQQDLVLADDAIKLFGYGRSAVKSLVGWDVEFSDLEITLTKPTAVTTAAVINSTSVPIDNGDGVMDDVSTVSSINIDSSAADPTVTNIGSYSGSTATLTLSAAQTLESGETLTFDGAGRTVTISGNVEIKQVGEAATQLSFDLEKFITATDES